jgi:hypothetical protein
MNQLFTVASWNVEHFQNENSRVDKIVDFISGQNGGPAVVPDIFAIYEVEGKDVYSGFMHAFPDHHFHLTEGKQTQEIFIGVHKRFQSFTTHRIEFKTGREFQRPGLLLTIIINNEPCTILFLHIKSGVNPEDFGLRDAAILSAFKLKKVLDNAQGKPSKYLFLGDLNTMGIDDPVPYLKTMDFSSEQEIERLRNWAGKRNMKVMPKEKVLINGVLKEATWYNGSSGYKPTNLDHVVASKEMVLKSKANGPEEIALYGWPNLPTADWKNWFKEYSDHALLYFEVWE